MDDVDVPQVDVAGLPVEPDPSAVLLDVREHDEWQRGHVAGAVHVPMGEIPGRMADLDQDVTYYVMCHLGGRSQRVAQYLARNGYRVANVSGGIQAWADAGRPVITDGGGPGTV
ncbi:rhodanese-like domain-containing protein [Mycobacterium sp. PS03-16]|uniref:rhodanese-like domain-containing protein n=1 Tax=Mycobacterium sp. PS03-16 TaxID=2559611 RepID=UPI00107399E5|nr:rhodanese-like domain-containing protein [Mycobacterium sp. PS03-16]TFV54266.1 rhodanese-like domain-containing protein [Mycobacterium sp. PS03-16]